MVIGYWREASEAPSAFGRVTLALQRFGFWNLELREIDAERGTKFALAQIAINH